MQRLSNYLLQDLTSQPVSMLKLNVTRFFTRAHLFNSNNPRFKFICFLTSSLFGLNAISNYESISKAEEEIEFRKKQLSKPVIEISGDQLVDLPWNESNLNEWLYRPIKIVGRPLHNRTQFIPRLTYGHRGYDYIVPLVTNENEDGSIQRGVLFNKGWIPKEFAPVCSREKIENAHPQEFIAVVTKNTELEHSFGQKGNAPILARNKWESLDLEVMAKQIPFVNQDKLNVALLERVDLNTPNDERNSEHYTHDASYSQDFPYTKSRAGILQLKEMPWDHWRKTIKYGIISGVSGGIGLLLVLA